MNYAKLAALIVQPPYDVMTDIDTANALNAVDATLFSERNVSYKTILSECNGAGTILDKLEAAATTIPDVKWAMVGISSESGIDIGHPKTRAMIDTLEAGAVLTTTEATALKTMAVNISKAQAEGLGVVKEGHVQTARNL